MRAIVFASVIAALAAPAFAQAPTTLQLVTTRGVVMDMGGTKVPVSYTPDGKLSAMNGQISGTWRIDGDKLCTRTSASPQEACAVYPAGKKSGDEFEVTGAMGAVKIRIN